MQSVMTGAEDNRESPVMCGGQTCTSDASFQATCGRDFVVLCEAHKNKTELDFRRKGWIVAPLSEEIATEWRAWKDIRS